MDFVSVAGLLLDIVGFILVFWKGDVFSPRISSGNGPPPQGGRDGDIYVQHSGREGGSNTSSGTWDRRIALFGAGLVVVGFILQAIPYLVNLICGTG